MESREKIRQHSLKYPRKFWLGKKRPLASEETKRKMSNSQKKVIHTSEWSKKVGDALRGRKRESPPEEVRKKLSEALKGKKSYLWKGGITSVNETIRKSVEYKLWREAVFKRDNYTCIWCGAKNGKGKTIILNADHIRPFALYPELRFAIDNGRTLCISCHKTTDTYLKRRIN